jgi:hypothetical protein
VTPVAQAKTSPLMGYYDNELIDDTSKFMSNVVDNVKIKPLNILSGIINKHNLETLKASDDSLNKQILFVAKYSLNGTLEQKPEHAEPL